jgi:hypothetical protein
LLALLLLLMPAPEAGADSWARPVVREVFSKSRDFFVRVVPGESVGETPGFAGAPQGRHAAAEFYRRQADRSYRLVAEAELLNPVAPVEFFVSNAGRLVTVDNWHSLGYGAVLAIYDATGKPLRHYELKDLFLPEELQRFPQSVSSIHWRNGALYLRDDETTLLVTVRSGADFLFGLETGRFQYCEPQGKSFRCRNDGRLAEWKTWRDVEVKR